MKLLEEIEAMRARLNELATGEHAIVKTMGEALSAVDQRLLEDVRKVAAAHEARRSVIMRELKMLAERLGALHHPQASVAALGDTSPMQAQQGPEPLLNGGADWRRAAANVHDELDKHFGVQPQISHVGH